MYVLVVHYKGMETISATNARAKLFQLVGNTDTEPVTITSKRGNSVLISEEDWESINETLFLSQFKGMNQKLKKGKETPLEDCINLKDIVR